MKIKFLCLLLLSMVSCEKGEDVLVDPNNLLIGNWADPNYDGEITSFKRVVSLPDEAYGMSFKANGEFVEHSSGWCGTPPLVFSDYVGNWELLENTLVKITKLDWPNNLNWRIITLTENELTIKIELTEQEKDYRELMQIFDEIYILSTSVSCTDASEWAFTAYGAKACGGPQGYIAYSAQIDTAAFLQKVEQYTEAENAYNIKWNIASTCDVPIQPLSVECQNSLPVFKY